MLFQATVIAIVFFLLIICCVISRSTASQKPKVMFLDPTLRVMSWFGVFFCIVFISWFYFVRYPAVLMSCWVSLVPAVVLPLSWIKLHLLIFLLLPSPAFGSALFAPALGRQYILFRIKGNRTSGPGKLNRDTLQNKTGNKAAPKTQTMTHQTPKEKKTDLQKYEIKKSSQF